MHQNILLWPCCTHAAGIRLGTGVKCIQVLTHTKRHSLHLIPGLIILTWYGCYSYYLSILPVPWQFFQCDHPIRTWVLDLPARYAGRFHCLLLEPHSDHNNNGGRQQANSYPTHTGFRNWEMYAIKQIKICAEYQDLLPRPQLDLSGTPGLWPIDPQPRFLTDQPWPGILHRS